MDLGYTTLMYDPGEIVSEGLGEIGACRYDGVEIGLPKVNAIAFMYGSSGSVTSRC